MKSLKLFEIVFEDFLWFIFLCQEPASLPSSHQTLEILIVSRRNNEQLWKAHTIGDNSCEHSTSNTCYICFCHLCSVRFQCPLQSFLCISSFIFFFVNLTFSHTLGSGWALGFLIPIHSGKPRLLASLLMMRKPWSKSVTSSHVEMAFESRKNMTNPIIQKWKEETEKHSEALVTKCFVVFTKSKTSIFGLRWISCSPFLLEDFLIILENGRNGSNNAISVIEKYAIGSSFVV